MDYFRSVEQYYKYIGIPNRKKQSRIYNLLSCCKEIRDTAYPMKNSTVTELQIVEFTARKEKDLIYINTRKDDEWWDMNLVVVIKMVKILF